MKKLCQKKSYCIYVIQKMQENLKSKESWKELKANSMNRQKPQ